MSTLPYRITCKACGWSHPTRKSEAPSYFKCPKCDSPDVQVKRQ